MNILGFLEKSIVKINTTGPISTIVVDLYMNFARNGNNTYIKILIE